MFTDFEKSKVPAHRLNSKVVPGLKIKKSKWFIKSVFRESATAHCESRLRRLLWKSPKSSWHRVFRADGFQTRIRRSAQMRTVRFGCQTNDGRLLSGFRKYRDVQLC